jgi:hypothetical protein
LQREITRTEPLNLDLEQHSGRRERGPAGRPQH